MIIHILQKERGKVSHSHLSKLFNRKKWRVDVVLEICVSLKKPTSRTKAILVCMNNVGVSRALSCSLCPVWTGSCSGLYCLQLPGGAWDCIFTVIFGNWGQVKSGLPWLCPRTVSHRQHKMPVHLWAED